MGSTTVLRGIILWLVGASIRSGRHLSIQVPAEIKIQLIKNKALTGVGIGYQICEALRAKWGQPRVPARCCSGTQAGHSVHCP